MPQRANGVSRRRQRAAGPPLPSGRIVAVGAVVLVALAGLLGFLGRQRSGDQVRPLRCEAAAPDVVRALQAAPPGAGADLSPARAVPYEGGYVVAAELQGGASGGGPSGPPERADRRSVPQAPAAGRGAQAGAGNLGPQGLVVWKVTGDEGRRQAVDSASLDRDELRSAGFVEALRTVTTCQP